MARKDLKRMEGERIGVLIIVRYAGEKRWWVRCDCGNERAVDGADLRRRDYSMCRHPEGVELRFWSHVVKTESCWVWVAGLKEDGYGSFRANEKSVIAHRWYWERINGPVEDGMELDHLCRNPACVRPDHLEPVTHQENVLRGNMRSVVIARGFAV
ncbi:HNH endonuclease signature motif containing protein [Paraburkholderia sacchari]|uniref:HNH endonuclease signature motif containing protein n=1 Tax=Paraburkholderia sacchari TaxID=159450 RepID=UPI003D98E1A9